MFSQYPIFFFVIKNERRKEKHRKVINSLINERADQEADYHAGFFVLRLEVINSYK